MLLIAILPKMVIPKIIMQTWKTKELPDKWRSSPLSIQQHMPDWEYVLMTDEDNYNFVAQYFPSFLSCYQSLPYAIQRADAIRYCWLYIKGGLYLDCDMELQGSLDHLFEPEGDLYLITSANAPNTITNGLMASKPGHPLWLRMLDWITESRNNINWERHLYVMWTTGPKALDKMVKSHEYPYVKLSYQDINPYTLCDTVYDKPSLIRPLEGSSWVGPLGVACQWVYCQVYCIWIIILAVAIILFLWW